MEQKSEGNQDAVKLQKVTWK